MAHRACRTCVSGKDTPGSSKTDVSLSHVTAAQRAAAGGGCGLSGHPTPSCQGMRMQQRRSSTKTEPVTGTRFPQRRLSCPDTCSLLRPAARQRRCQSCRVSSRDAAHVLFSSDAERRRRLYARLLLQHTSVYLLSTLPVSAHTFSFFLQKVRGGCRPCSSSSSVLPSGEYDQPAGASGFLAATRQVPLYHRAETQNHCVTPCLW